MSPRSEVRRAAGIVHPCLESPPGAVPLGEVRLTDRRKVGILLQAAGLLCFLERAGLHLANGWRGACLAADGRLVVGENGLRVGRSSRPVQELLLELTVRLFGDGRIAGRGEARRAVRALLELWQQSLVPLRPEESVARILEEARFLWAQEHGVDRGALAGAMDRGEPGDPRPWLAAPRSLRERFLGRCRTAEEVRELLAGPEASDLWGGDGEDDGAPAELAAAGRWRAAVSAWERRPPGTEEERTLFAAALAALGRFEAALDAVTGLRAPAARAVAARCHLDLGQLGAARAALRALEDVPLPARLTPELAEIASRVHASYGKPEKARDWIRRALAATKRHRRAALHARLAAAGAAWDLGDLATMDRYLEAARPAVDDPELAWRWHQVWALRAIKAGDGGPEVVNGAASALRAGRRRLTRRQAAGLWNDLGFGRARTGDLRGAERAFLHALRLEAGCDGPRKTTLVLANIAEIRLRQGRLLGVREILVRSEEENRRSGNLRGLAYDVALWARFELALGRPAAALALCREALVERPGAELAAERELLSLLAARALGWLGRPCEAAEELGRVSRDALVDLEPEERPALRALAGDPQGALAEAAGTPWGPIWKCLVAGEIPPAPAWEAVSGLTPYRAARLVFDGDLLVSGSAPAPWRRQAIDTFREMGAVAPAERLEARDGGPWAVVAMLLSEWARNEEDGTTPGPLTQSPLKPSQGEFVGESPALLAALDRLARLAPGELPVLILGESGTGKELAARRLHAASARGERPFVAVNCAALSETLLLSDLFGHARGSFTGADRDRKGVFETAHGGTVFLDEIGDLPLAAQGMLLRVLQEGEIRRLGESEPRRVNVRVLAATHRNLTHMVDEGSFRRDLYYRLCVGSVELPPLRERGDDVLLIAESILAAMRPPGRLAEEARPQLLTHRWPGNVRELQNVLSVAAALAGGRSIKREHLELRDGGGVPAAPYHQQVDALRRRLIADAMAESGDNCAQAARRLGVSAQMVSYLANKYGVGGRSR